MCWRCYLQESAPQAWDTERAEGVLPVLRQLIETMLAWRPHA
jgi:N-formylglutamate deformylase